MAEIPVVHQKLIDDIVRVVAADPAIQSAWLHGSLGAGEGDEWSDVDVLLIVDEKDLPATSAHYKDNVALIANPVFVQTITASVLHVVTDDWRRFDLVFAPPVYLSQRAPAGLRKLFARPGAASPSGAPRPEPPPDAIAPLITEFIRVLGLAGVVINRGEYLVALEGAGLLRSLTIELMLLENGRRRADRGVKRLNQFLHMDQREALEALPPLSADRDALMTYFVAIAHLFLPRAQALAGAREIAWPEAFETATRAYLHRSLGVTI